MVVADERVEKELNVLRTAVGREDIPHEVHIILDCIVIENDLTGETLNVENCAVIVEVGNQLAVCRGHRCNQGALIRLFDDGEVSNVLAMIEVPEGGP